MLSKTSTGVALAVVCMAFSVALSAAENITRCDELTAHPLDPDRITTGVGTSAVQLDAAIAACLEATDKDPGNARLRYQLARALFYNEEYEWAMPHLEFAAGAGYRQAQFVLGYVYEGGRGSAEKDICRAADLWLKSARAGRLAALMSYPHHFARGQFDGCSIEASSDEMWAFLDRAAERNLDYYQGVLLADIREDLAKKLSTD